MTKQNPGISPIEFGKLQAARSEHAVRAFQRMALENAWRAQLLAPFIPPTPANPKLADLDEKTRHLIKSVVQHVPERDERDGKPRAYAPFPFDAAWTDIQPPGAAVEWYGPDTATGRPSPWCANYTPHL